MKIYFAGNFPQMKKPELEKSVAEFVQERYGIYRRLISFYFVPDIENVLKLKGENNGKTKM